MCRDHYLCSSLHTLRAYHDRLKINCPVNIIIAVSLALDGTQSELFDVKAKFDEVAAARYIVYCHHSYTQIL